MRTAGMLELFLTLGTLLLLARTDAKVLHKVRCLENSMEIDVMKNADVADIYLQQLKGFPDCRPEVEGEKATFRLPYDDIFRCGTTKVVNKLTGRTVYYHRVMVEYLDNKQKKGFFLAKCAVGTPELKSPSELEEEEEAGGGARVPRQVDLLPLGFQEDDEIEITSEVTGRAPTPELTAIVKQNGQTIDTNENVVPGTPLQMELSLDTKSADIYGLLVSSMQVTDTRSKNEAIIANGCSVDPFLFENFFTTNGDYLNARFRAFKFPESNFVQFEGKVDVCLDRCNGIPCFNGQIGYGRRKRNIPEIPADPNKIFEITMTTFIKVNYQDFSKFMQADKLGNTGSVNKTEEVEEVRAGYPGSYERIALTETDKMEYSFVDTNAAISVISSAHLFTLSLSFIIIAVFTS